MQSIDSISDLAWHVVKKNGKVYPCRRNCRRSEVIGLAIGRKYDKDNMELIQYLGQLCTDSMKYDSVATNQLIPILNEADESHFATYMSRYLEELKKNLGKKYRDNDPSHGKQKVELDMMFEEYALNELVKRVQSKQSNPSTKAKNTSKQVDSKDEDESLRLNPYLQESAKVTPNKLPNLRFNNNDGEPHTRRKADEDDKVDNDSDDDDFSVDSAGKAKGKEKLRVGDIIQYDPPVSVAGIRGNLQTAKILGINPRTDDGRINKFPLILSDGQLLERDSRVKRVQFCLYKKTVSRPDAPFKAIGSYSLAKDGATNMRLGLQETGRLMADVLNKDMPDEIKDFCHTFQSKKSGRNQNEEASESLAPGDESGARVVQQGKKARIQSRKSTGSVLKSVAPISRQAPSGSNKRRRSQPVAPSVKEQKEPVSRVQPAWKSHLSNLIKSVKDKISRSTKRFKPHMTVSQLELVLSVWPYLEEKIATHHRQSGILDRKAPIRELSSVLGVRFENLDNFVRGDEDKLVKPQDIEIIANRLTEWLAQQPILESSSHGSGERNDFKEANGDEVEDSSKAKRRRHHGNRNHGVVPGGSIEDDYIGRRESRSSVGLRKRRASSQSTVEMARAAAIVSATLDSSSSSLSLITATPNKTRGRRGRSISGYEPPSVANARKRKLKTSGSENEVPAVAKKRRSSVATANSVASDKQTMKFDWRRNISKLMDEVEKDLTKKNSRCKPNMSKEQLRLVMEAWQQIEQEARESNNTIYKIMADLAEDFGCGHFQFTFFMKGDRKKVLSEVLIQSLSEKLSEWLASKQHNKAQKQSRDESTRNSVGAIATSQLEEEPLQALASENTSLANGHSVDDVNADSQHNKGVEVKSSAKQSMPAGNAAQSQVSST